MSNSLVMDFREIQLTQGKVAIVDAADYEWLSQYKWFAHRSRHLWYASRKLPGSRANSKHSRMHREILRPADGMQVDHINGNGLDNRRSNLRAVTQQQNMWNQRTRRNNSSGQRGVDFHKGRWIARIHENGRRVHLGCFLDKESAIVAYQAAAKRIRGEFNPVAIGGAAGAGACQLVF